MPYTNKVIFLDDGERAVLTKDIVRVYDDEHQELTKKLAFVDLEWKQGGKGNYDHFMIKEIEDQPQTIRQALIQDDRLITRMARRAKGKTRYTGKTNYQ